LSVAVIRAFASRFGLFQMSSHAISRLVTEFKRTCAAGKSPGRRADLLQPVVVRKTTLLFNCLQGARCWLPNPGPELLFIEELSKLHNS
jgi:hypothetical protein